MGRFPHQFSSSASTKDFPAETAAYYGIEIQHPDEFLIHVLDLAPGAVLEALQRLRQSLKNPPVAIEQYLARLEQHELSGFELSPLRDATSRAFRAGRIVECRCPRGRVAQNP